MFKKLTVKGLLLGIKAGLLVTLFDSFIMLTPNAYVPYNYPLLLITFNTFFWMTIGGLSGFTLWAFVRKGDDPQGKEIFYWVLFFLLPFAVIYGVLGRFFVPISLRIRHGFPVFDHHLSFVWVSLILIFLIFYCGKKARGKELFSISFTLELVIFILLFQFCSKIIHIQTISTYYFRHLIFFKEIGMEQTQYHVSVYIMGVVLITGLYFITFFKIRPLNKGTFIKRNWYTIVILFIIVSVCLTGFFTWSNKRYFKEEFSLIDSRKDQRAINVSSVILIVLDTVRADRLSPYGNPGVTKNLEAFSRDALIFENCVAPSPWTLPSHASLFTGLYPTEHGSHHHLDSKKKTWLGFPLPRPLDEEFVTLAEIFRDSGYTTCAIASNYSLLNAEFKMDQGFQFFDNRENIGKVYVRHPFRPVIHLFCNLVNIYPKFIMSFRTADDITRECLHLIEKLDASPFFLFINYMDAHDPYRPPSPFSGYFLDTSFPRLYRFKQYFLRFVLRFTKRWWNGKSWNSYHLSQYDGEIAYLDSELGKFFYRLKKMGNYDSSLIIVASDHGELFGENGIYGHECFMYEGVVKIPLMIKFPYSTRVGREDVMITLADLFSTILSICELPLPDEISAKAFGNASSPVVAELYKDRIGAHRILYEGKYKFMHYEHGRDPELYDLDRDPMEKDNLAEKLPERTLLMERKMKEWKKVHGPKYVPSVERESEDLFSQELREGLKALGYIQ